jgi:exopolysaccharide biosynthesis WecB/TagA/CpsF family protein
MPAGDDGSAPPPLPTPVPLGPTDLHPLTLDHAADRVLSWAERREAAVVVTPNVDHLVTLQKDADFRAAYAHTALRVCDGVPLLLVLKLCGRPLPGRVNGTDLFEAVCARAAQEGRSVFIAGGLPDVLERALTALPLRFPGLRVTGHSPPFAFEGTAADLELQQRITEDDPDVVMVCFGAPRSEKWAVSQSERRPGVHLCVGSAVDFAAGARRRAPRFMQRFGLEWLHRLLQEPRRLWRRYLVEDRAFFSLAAKEIVRSRLGRRR